MNCFKIALTFAHFNAICFHIWLSDVQALVVIEFCTLLFCAKTPSFHSTTSYIPTSGHPDAPYALQRLESERYASMAPRPAYVHPSGLSPAEHDTYAAWIDELDSHISKLGRGLRFGEMLAFIRKHTVVDREAEVRNRSVATFCDRLVQVELINCMDYCNTQIMSFFGSIPQQQSLGVGEFIAILRLVCLLSIPLSTPVNEVR